MINEKLNKDILDLINENKTEINNLKGKMLWKNNNPTINFNAQNVNLLDSDWDSYEVIYGANTSSDSKLMSAKSIKGRGCNCLLYTSPSPRD